MPITADYKEPWGWSKLDTYRKCKAEFAYQYIKKLPKPGNDAMARGNTMHEDIEAYMRGWISELKGPAAEWQRRFDELKTMPFTAEQALGLNKQWQVLPDWFHADTWLRAKMDAKVKTSPTSLSVIDWKSGKYRVPSDDQIELYAIVGSAIHPEVEEVTAEFWFIDQDDIYSRLYKRDELMKLRTKFEKEASHIYSTQLWIEEPSRSCKYCDFSVSKGGPCKY